MRSVIRNFLYLSLLLSPLVHGGVANNEKGGRKRSSEDSNDIQASETGGHAEIEGGGGEDIVENAKILAQHLGGEVQEGGGGDFSHHQWPSFEGHERHGGEEHKEESSGHGIHLGGHDLGGGEEHIDLKPKVEVQHHHIPTKTIEHTKPVHVEVIKKIGVPVPHPVGVPTPQVIKVPVPQPYAVHVPVPYPIHVPIYKLVPQEIEKKVPINVDKLVPVYVDKPVKIEVEKHHVEYVDKPYPVYVPVYKHIFHHIPEKHGHHEHHG